MATVARDETLRLDTTFVQPLSSPQFGGAHIDHALELKLTPVLQRMKDRGHDHLDPKAVISRLLLENEYMKAKHEIDDLKMNIGLPTENFPMVDGNGISMKDGTLIIEK